MRRRPRGSGSVPATGTIALVLAGCMAGHDMEVRPPTGTCASIPGASVTWARPTAGGEQSKMDGWCASVGAPVLRQVAESGPPADSLVVALWNVEVGTGDLTRFLREEIGFSCEPGDGSGDTGRVPFVLLLQEAHRASAEIPPVPDGVAFPSRIENEVRHEARDDVVAIAERCGLSLFYAPSMRNGREAAGEIPEDRGNAILASVPLTNPTAIELPLETQRRVAIAAVAHPPGWEPVRVVSFHFDVAANLLRMLVTGNSTRLGQGLGLAVALQEIKPGGPGLVSVLGGDVNSWSEKETVIRHLVEWYPQSPAPTPEGTRGSYPTDHMFVGIPDGSGVTVDYWSFRVIPETYGSDHRGKLLVLRAGDD